MQGRLARDIKWRQDLTSVTLDFELRNTTIKKITITVGKRFVRVTCPEKSYAKVVDLWSSVSVDPSVPNRVDYDGNTLTIHLRKFPPRIWDGLWVEGISKEELMARREEDVKELDVLNEQKYKDMKSTKAEHTSLVTKEKMKMDETKRDFIEGKKEQEKKDAFARIFDDNQPQAEAKFNKSIGETENITSKASRKENEIWGEEDLDKEEQRIAQAGYNRGVRVGDREEYSKNDDKKEAVAFLNPVPAVRNSTSQPETVKLEFTERIFPTLAMRESQFKEAPAPKLRKLAQKVDKNPDNTFKSPIWLKDKGDEFLQAGDLVSAIDAYNNSLRLDPTYWTAYSNRSICYLKMHNLDDCYADCSFLLGKFIEMEGNNQITSQLLRLREKVCLRSLAIDALRGDFHKFREMASILMSQPFVRPEHKDKIKADLEVINAREEEVQSKRLGDELVKSGQYSAAVVEYDKVCLTLTGAGNNERILSNLALCELKLEKFERAVEIGSKAIEIIEEKMARNFAQTDKSKHSSYFKGLLIKNLYRRAQAQIKRNKVVEAEADLRTILILDEKNEEARNLRKHLAQQRDESEAAENKLEGDKALKENKHSEALEKYRISLSKTEAADKPIEYLSVLLNMTVCHSFLDQNDDIISDCIKGLRIISKFTKSIIKLEKEKLTKEQKEKMSQLELRFYIRKGNAFLKKGQIYHAKSDFEEAIKLAPDNNEIRQSLDKIAML